MIASHRNGKADRDAHLAAPSLQGCELPLSFDDQVAPRRAAAGKDQALVDFALANAAAMDHVDFAGNEA